MLNLEQLQQRRDQLSDCLIKLETDLKVVRDRGKVLRQEIANGKGAIVEVDRMIELWD